MPPDELTEPDSPRPATVARRAPLLWVAAAIIAGYVCAGIWPKASPTLLASAAVLFAASALVVAWRAPQTGFRQRKITAAWGAVFLLAGTLLAWAWHIERVPLPPAAWSTLPPREAMVTLRIQRAFSLQPGADYAGGLAEVAAAPPVFQELEGQSVLYHVRVGPGEKPPARGAIVQVDGLLSYLPDLAQEPEGDATPEQKLAVANAARFRAYVHAQGAWFDLARGRKVAEIAPPNAWQRWLAAQHARIEALLRHGPETWEENYGDIYVALALGEPAILATGQREAFTNSGVIYLFAISGLHVGVLAMALWWLLMRIPRLPHAAAEVISLAVVWLYVEIAGGTPSARRLALMLTFYLLAKWCGRARSPLAGVVAAGVGTMMVDPLALDNSGFELSFGVVLGLILYAPLLWAAVEKRWLPWRDVPALSLAPWQKITQRLWRFCAGLLVTAWTAVLCSTALTAEFFGTFSIHNLYLTVLIFPLTCAALWAGAMAVVVGLVGLTPLAWLVNAVGLLAVGMMNFIAKFALSVPGFIQLEIEPARAGSFAALAVIAAMLLAQPKDRPPKWWYYALPVAILAGFAVFTVRLA